MEGLWFEGSASREDSSGGQNKAKAGQSVNSQPIAATEPWRSRIGSLCMKRAVLEIHRLKTIYQACLLSLIWSSMKLCLAFLDRDIEAKPKRNGTPRVELVPEPQNPNQIP